VVTATDGVEALRLVKQGAFRLVVADWEMPEMNGIELCRAIREDESLGYVYVLMVTGRASLEDRLEGVRAGADDFLSKPFDPEELLARIKNADRVLSLETREVAIFALAHLAESRDPDTGAHLERVRGYSRVLARHLADHDRFRGEIDAEFIRLIYLTSPLHDIGKVGIPDRVLLKPGRLSDREFEIMKTHTEIGARTLEGALTRFPGAKFLQMGRDVAACHHEQYDGAGYPLRLEGDAIPLSARIVALADVYDALTSKRIYKKAMSHETAWGMIVEESGGHFDPDIVGAFIKTEDKFISIRSLFDDAGAFAA
jgi:putative two-component system response regulator